MKGATLSRLARVVPISLVLGLLTTFVVSAALAVYLPHTNFTHQSAFIGDEVIEPPQRTHVFIPLDRWLKPGMERRYWYAKDLPGIPGIAPLVLDYGAEVSWSLHGGTLTLSDRDLWGRFGAVARSSDRHGGGVEDARGWPRLAFWCELQGRGIMGQAFQQCGVGARGGLPISDTDGSVSLGDFRAIPFRPIWRGVAIGTAFYAALWLIPLVACPLLRTASRRRRGLCPKCAYDLRAQLAAGCPECGWRRQR